MTPNRLPPALVVVAALAVGALAARSVGRDGDALATVPILWLAAACIAVGELLRARLDHWSSAPVSAATGIALALSPIRVPHGGFLDLSEVLVVVGVVMLAALTLRVVAGRRPWVADASARYLGVAAAAGLVRLPLDVSGGSLLAWEADPRRPVVTVALVLGLLAACAVGTTVAVRGTLNARAWGLPPRTGMGTDLGFGWVVGLAIMSSSSSAALAYPVVGSVGGLLFLWPLVLALIGLRRQAAIVAANRQTIEALSTITDITGHTRAGHARRVADLCVAVARRLAVPEREVSILEQAALLHDLGQVAVANPIPGGATVLAAPADQQDIADDGRTIAAYAGVSEAVCALLQLQTTPYRRVRELGEALPLGARILKVANAYADLSTEGDRSRSIALERLHLGLGYEYDPMVVGVLERVTTPGGATTTS